MTNETQSGNDNSATEPSGVPFGLKLFVYAMGVMIIVMMIALVVKVMMKSDDQADVLQAVAPLINNSSGVPAVMIEAAAGARIKNTSMDRGILSVVVESESGDKVILFHIRDRRVIATLELAQTE